MPDELAEVWPGCGTDADFGGQASIKLQFRWELLTGAFEHLSLTDGKTHDCKAQKGFNPLAAGSLRLASWGLFFTHGFYGDWGKGAVVDPIQSQLPTLRYNRHPA